MRRFEARVHSLFVKMEIVVFFCISFITFMSSCEHKEAEVIYSASDSYHSETVVDQNENEEQINEEPVPLEMLYIDVSGAVKQPGVYKLPVGSRIYQAIEAAGGFLPTADYRNLNRAQIMTDGQQIYVYTTEELKKETPDKITEEIAFVENQDQRIDLNTATLEQLMTLPGIGKTRAEAVLNYRKETGLFSAIEDIMYVQGIKEGTFLKIKEQIVVK